MKTTEEKRRGIIITLVVCAIVFVVMFAVVNISAVSTVISSVLSVFSPIIIGFAIAYMLNPILRMFEFKVYKKIPKKNVIRGLSIFSTYMVAVLFVAAFLLLLIPSLIDAIVDLVSNFHTYVENTVAMINSIINKFSSNENFNEYVDEAALKKFIFEFFSASEGLFETVFGYVKEYGMGLVVGVKNVILGIFISIYVLLSKEKLQAQLRKLGKAVLSESRNQLIGKYINLAHRTFSSYFVGKIIGSLMVFVMVFLLMALFGVPYPLLVATIVAITDIIPVFGPIIGAIPSFFIIFVVDPIKAFIFVIILLVVQQIEGNIISPKILGDATGISSLSVIVAIIVMGAYFGFVGMLVGVPVFAVGTTVVKEIIDTRLRKKNLSTETADYYLKDAVADPYDEHIPLGKKIFDNIVRLVKTVKEKLAKALHKEKNNQEKLKEKEDDNNGK